MMQGSALTRTYNIETPRSALATLLAKQMKNGLLGALPHFVARWGSQFEPVLFTAGQTLWETNSLLTHVYFPTTAIITLRYGAKRSSTADVAVVGSEGIIGVAVVMGSDRTWSRAEVQSGGDGFRLNVRVMKDELARTGPVLSLLLRYTQALITQITQTAVCNRLHCLDQRLCRRLLVILDRWSSDELAMTHDLIANALGVRREGVTQAADKLRQAGIIHYSRGHIAVLDRAGLEAASCECYSVVKREYDRLLVDRWH